MKASELRKKQETVAKELDRRSADLKDLMAKRDALSEEINSVIDADDLPRVEKLTAQLTVLENKIRAEELTIARKKETLVNPTEIATASNEEMKEWQRKAEKAQAAADNAFNDYLRKLLDAASIVVQAWDARAEYIKLIPGIEDPYSINAQTTDFNGVGCSIEWGRYKEWDEHLLAINPDALGILHEATRERFNRWAGRDFAPVIPDVTISKHD